MRLPRLALFATAMLSAASCAVASEPRRAVIPPPISNLQPTQEQPCLASRASCHDEIAIEELVQQEPGPDTIRLAPRKKARVLIAESALPESALAESALSDSFHSVADGPDAERSTPIATIRGPKPSIPRSQDFAPQSIPLKRETQLQTLPEPATAISPSEPATRSTWLRTKPFEPLACQPLVPVSSTAGDASQLQQFRPAESRSLTSKLPSKDNAYQVPDSLRPVDSSRSAGAPRPAGAVPFSFHVRSVDVPYRSPSQAAPAGIGEIQAIATEIESHQIAQALMTVPTDEKIQASNNKVVTVGHHGQMASGTSAHVTDLHVEELPAVTTAVARNLSTRRVIQTAGEETFDIPVAVVPPSKNATIQAENDLVTLVATDAELRSVLRMIADHHELNLVIGPEVAGPTTVSIRGARLDEVLDAILGVAGFHWHQVGNLLYVTSSESGTLDPRVQGRRLQVYPLNYVSGPDIEPVVTGLLSPVGQVFVSQADKEDQLKSRELLVVEDNESGHMRVSQYLSQVDVQPSQVLVEAHILQIDLNDDERHGINLTALARVAGANVSLSGTSFAEEPEGPSVALRLEGTDMESFIEAIKTHTNSRTLASPKVSVVNRQTAKVQIGQRLPFAVATTTQTATVQNVQFLDVGIVLTVTPVITEDGKVLMTVLPKVSGGKITESGFPEEDTTEVSTTVLMSDGGGMVIGGLIRESNTNSASMLPKFGNVPIIKHLFRRDTVEARRNELVVAMVTHVIHGTQSTRHHEQVELQQTLPPYAATELNYQPELAFPEPAFR